METRVTNYYYLQLFKRLQTFLFEYVCINLLLSEIIVVFSETEHR